MPKGVTMVFTRIRECDRRRTPQACFNYFVVSLALPGQIAEP